MAEPLPRSALRGLRPLAFLGRPSLQLLGLSLGRLRRQVLNAPLDAALLAQVVLARLVGVVGPLFLGELFQGPHGLSHLLGLHPLGQPALIEPLALVEKFQPPLLFGLDFAGTELGQFQEADLSVLHQFPPGLVAQPKAVGIVDMHRVNCAGLLVQDNPRALVLAVLCDFGGREPQEVVNYIVRRLNELTGADEQRFREYMTMLEILCENRDLRAQVEEAERMLTQIDIERLPSYVIGMERGEIRGELRGEIRGEGRGLERGRTLEKRLIVRRLLARMDAAEVAGLLGMTPEDVTRIAAADDGTDTP